MSAEAEERGLGRSRGWDGRFGRRRRDEAMGRDEKKESVAMDGGWLRSPPTRKKATTRG
jgi:hypothetical protein